MRKQEFMRRLSNCLVLLPETERQATLEFYIEQIDDRIDDGMDEEQAVASLESPEDIAAAILINRDADKDAAPLEMPHETANNSRKKVPYIKIIIGILIIILLIMTGFIWAPIALILIAIPVTIYLGLWGILLSAAACTIGFAFAAVVLISIGIGTFSTSSGAAISHVGAGIGCIGLGILCALIALYGSIALVKATKASFAWIGKKINERKRKRVSQELMLKNNLSTPQAPSPTDLDHQTKTAQANTDPSLKSPKRPDGIITREED